MRITIWLCLIMASILELKSQERIIYDLDSYIRVDVNLRATQFSPDFNLFYDHQLNVPGRSKYYTMNIGGQYINNHQINNATRQKSIYHDVELDLQSGSQRFGGLVYKYQSENRTYSDNTYFVNGMYLSSDINYVNEQSSVKRYSQSLNFEYNIGFGFGRLEVINNAWIGARILEELQKRELLLEIPTPSDMRMYFDRIGDLEYERVLDPRLRSIYIIENIISYIENQGWVAKGSVPAFATIYDAYRYENFIFRQSGERLEFTLTPKVKGRYNWWGSGIIAADNYIQPGFIGKIEYSSHKNGDLEFYTVKSYGGILEHSERFYERSNESIKTISGDMFFNYEFRYMPSLRTNYTLRASFLGGFTYADSYDANISVFSSFISRYYFSPSTQLECNISLAYRDSRFQLGDYQPRITGMVSFDVIHFIR